MKEWIWHKSTGRKNKHEENITLCNRLGAVTNMNKMVNCNKCRSMLHLRKVAIEAERTVQRLNDEIAALESRLRMVGCISAEDTEELCSIREKMRQLSAVK